MKLKNKKQEVQRVNYKELVMAKLNQKLAENAQKMQRATEAQEKLLDIRTKEGNSPALEERIATLKTLIKQIAQERKDINRNYGVPSEVLGAANRLDSNQKYEPYLPAVNDMNAAIKQYNAAFKKYKKQLAEVEGTRSLQLHVLEQGFSKFANDHSIYFESFFVNTENLKAIIDKFLKEEQPTKNRDTSQLDEIVNSAK